MLNCTLHIMNWPMTIISHEIKKQQHIWRQLQQYLRKYIPARQQSRAILLWALHRYVFLKWKFNVSNDHNSIFFKVVFIVLVIIILSSFYVGILHKTIQQKWKANISLQASRLSSNAFLSEIGDQRFKSRAGHIKHCIPNGLPSLQHFFKGD